MNGPSFHLLCGALIAALGTQPETRIMGDTLACVWEPTAGVHVALAVCGGALLLAGIAGTDRGAWPVTDPLVAARHATAWVAEHRGAA